MDKIKLYEGLPFSVDFQGKRYRMRPWYDRVLKIFDLFKDKELTGQDKTLTAMRLLDMPRRAPAGALTEAFRILFGPDPKDHKNKVFDFSQDAGYIYASFLQAYGIDLYKARGKLHWLAFIDLFNGLPEDTQMAKIIAIRARPVPKPNGHNSELIASEMRLKAQFALKKTPEEIEADRQAGLQRLYNQLLKLAGE